MLVFRRIYDELLQLKLVDDDCLHVPVNFYPDRRILKSVHCPDFVDAFCDGRLDAKALRRIGFPWSEALVKRTCCEISGTLLTAEIALQQGIAVSCAGGTHHAHYDFGSGFCIFNDLAITARSLISRGLVTRVAIIDLDVHQGDGTASLCGAWPDVYTFSMHAGSNFPARKARSDLDVALPDGTNDDAYLRELATHVPTILRSFNPGLVLYDAGVDIHVEDTLGNLAVTDGGLYRRDALVLDQCAAMGIPVAGFVGGGYAKDLGVLARRHAQLARAANDVFASRSDHAG